MHQSYPHPQIQIAFPIAQHTNLYTFYMQCKVEVINLKFSVKFQTVVGRKKAGRDLFSLPEDLLILGRSYMLYQLQFNNIQSIRAIIMFITCLLLVAPFYALST